MTSWRRWGTDLRRILGSLADVELRGDAVLRVGERQLAAVSLVLGGRTVGTTTDPRDLVALLERERQVFTSVRGTNSPFARCNLCREWVLRAVLSGGRLGIGPAYCSACIGALERRCRQIAARFPEPDEFFCRLCDTIRPLEHLAPRDADGRRRWVCRVCRARQVAAAGLRRANRTPAIIRSMR